MSWLEYLALTVALWTLMGLIGLTISLVRRERRKFREGVGALIGVWVIYLAALLIVSHRQPGQRVAMGQTVCFHAMCFRVVGIDEVPEFPKRNDTRLERVVVQVTNRGKKEAHDPVRAYLVDAQGRRWEPSNAVSGNPLSARLLANGTMVSEPVFRMAKDAASLTMVLTHGRWSWHRMVIGDAESLRHRPKLMLLER